MNTTTAVPQSPTGSQTVSLPAKVRLWRALFLGLTLIACLPLSVTAADPDLDCSMCHDETPLPAEHVPLEEFSLDSCRMCHEASGDDPFFQTIHRVHGEELGCETCHSDSSADSATRLKEILGGQ